jgi:phage terminase large subunit-like protein
MRQARPAASLLLVATALLVAGAASAAGSAVHLGAIAASAATARYPVELALLLSRPRETRLRDAKRRAEACFLDFVELMWPVIEKGNPFVRGNVQEAIALHLEAVTAGKITKLLCNVPPGSTKSLLVNVFWPAWEWGPKNRPDLRYMSWSYSPDLTLEHNELCRKVLKSEIYQRFWGDRFTLDDSSDAKGFYRNDKAGWRRSSSIKGAATGFRADRLIFDDPHNVKDADSTASLEEATRWFAKTLPTRVRNTTGDVKVRVPYWVRDVHGLLEDDPEDPRPVTASATVGIMQRVHLHDISGVILENPALGYEILLIEMRYKGDEHPARRSPNWRPSTIGYRDWRTQEGDLADPIRFPEAKVAELELQLMLKGGADAVAAQFDQWPLQLGGSWFTEKTLPILEPDAAPPGVDKRGWDWAASESPTANQTADARVRRGADKCWYLMDSAAMHGGPGDVDERVRQRHREDPKNLDWSIPRDPGAAGIHFAAYVIRELAPGRYVHDTPETGSKVTRMKPVSGQAKIGNFKIVRHPGCEITRSQLIDFPYGELDIPDAISRAFAAHVHAPAQGEDHGGFGGGTDDAVAAPPPASESTLIDWSA